MVLVSIRNGLESRTDRRYGSQADGSLLINRVEESDERMYLCNMRKTVYLRVTADPDKAFLSTDQMEGAADIQQSPDWWKIPVGVAVGASLMLLSVLTLKLCSKTANSNRAVPETVYEEIQDTSEQFGVESPYYSTITETPTTSTAAYLHPYSTVSRPQAEAFSDQAGVYSLIQKPLQTENTAGVRSEWQ